ncbi:UTP--glucose-1-phosphate uridylyltransferase [bacterium]|nr:UTP--glucose-1-phosphate uridylyltransferase [bacterium]
MKIEKAVIPVAGLGTRLLPATKSQPKEMLPVGRKPAVQYVVEEIINSNISQILFVTGRKKTSIENHFDPDPDLIKKLKESGKFSLLKDLEYEKDVSSFYYIRQSVQAGLADAIRLAKNFVGKEPFIVALGDSMIRSSDNNNLLKRMIDAHLKTKSACTIAVEEIPKNDVYKYGIVEVKDKTTGNVSEVKDLIEKPEIGKAKSNLAVAARYVFDPVIFDLIDRTIPDDGGELQITDSIRLMIKRDYKVHCVKLADGEKRYDIGNFESYFKAFIDFALLDDKYGYLLRQYLIQKMHKGELQHD